MELGKETREVKVHVDNLTKRFGDLLVLDQISFDVYKGELLCVVGPTGCGKTTFLNCLTHIYDLTAGQILMDGKPVNAKTSNIAYIFQGDSTMPWLTVAQNVAFGLNIKHTPPKQRDELVDKYLDIVGLTKFRNYYPKQLSSSMLQQGVHCAGLRHRAGAAADGRAIRSVGYRIALQAGGRTGQALGDDGNHRYFHYPQH